MKGTNGITESLPAHINHFIKCAVSILSGWSKQQPFPLLLFEGQLWLRYALVFLFDRECSYLPLISGVPSVGIVFWAFWQAAWQKVLVIADFVVESWPVVKNQMHSLTSRRMCHQFLQAHHSCMCTVLAHSNGPSYLFPSPFFSFVVLAKHHWRLCK